MAALEKLPNEQVGLVFASAPDLHTAVSPSATNLWLREIWLQDSELFTIEILRSNMIAYLQAVELALAEERLEGTSAQAIFTTAKPPTQCLLSNGELAKSAAAASGWTIKVQTVIGDSLLSTMFIPHTILYESSPPQTAIHKLSHRPRFSRPSRHPSRRRST